MARTTVPNELVAVNAIQGTLIADNAITAVHIATNAVSGTLIADNAVTSTHIAENHITATQIAQNTITVTHLADSAVENAKLGADAVTGAKLADNAVDSEHYTDGSIDTAHIGDLQVTAAKIGANAVTLAKMASLARGSILIGNSSADVTALAIGSNDYVLTSDGTDIAWEAASSFNADAAQVFNESGNDVDFRIESADSTHMFQVDAGTNKIVMSANPADDTQATPHDILTLAVPYANAGGTNGAAGLGPAILFKVPDDETNPSVGGRISVVRSAADDSDSSSDMVFETSQYDETLDEALRIAANGDVLIGQTSQTGYTFAQKLVVGDGDANDGITIQSGSTHQGNLAFNHSDGTTAYGRILYQHDTNYMAFMTNNAEKMRIYSASSAGTPLVKIGTAHGNGNLCVQSDDGSWDGGITIEADSTTGGAAGYGALFYSQGGHANSNVKWGIGFLNNNSESGNYDDLIIINKGADTTLDVGARDDVQVWFDKSTNNTSFGGNVGIGTTSPGVALHINHATDVATRWSTTSGATYSFQIGQYYTTWQGLAHPNIWQPIDGSASSDICITTATNNATAGIVIDASSGGNVGIKTASPTYPLEVTGSSAKGILITGVGYNANTGCIVTSPPGNTTYEAMVYLNSSGSNVGHIQVSSANTSYTTSSDYRLKENVDYTWDATTRIKQLKPARFNWIADDTNTLQDGFLAHEVSSIVPEAITGEKDATDDDGNPELQGIDHSKLVPLLVKTVQELEARIATLEG